MRPLELSDSAAYEVVNIVMLHVLLQAGPILA